MKKFADKEIKKSKNFKVEENWSWKNLKLKKFEIWSWRNLKFEVEEILNLKLKKIEAEEIWSCRNFKLNKFEVEKNWSWREVEEIWSWKILSWRIGLFWGSGKGSKTVLRSTHAVERLLFPMFSSILTFAFDLILGSVCTFWGPNGLFFWVRVAFKNYFRVYSCRWTTFVFYSSFNFDFGFWLNFGSFLAFRGPNGLFLGSG